ncbi:T9SS type A sorting domain-containing protein [Siansivirga zeaxanthinifaciens]|uniref:Secretion system C-terminal sorting domain-containing protein n=1 Tax=Siansivirga zeaxanthinifaciens CC-SAMT-1 TaxID=1454006 RepID=A0A0C5WDL2_9FLAO|nr:T9SS type A sorting domain-containing protein [Siansivirga zeaxanthinifaciens]AJR04357.1 hypothetical protein AW14_12545 [Siansivirga zeaxanthinifaciens CC-SAMT-1]
MKPKFYIFFLVCFQIQNAFPQVTLEADGSGVIATYTLIRNVLGSNAIETPDLNGDKPATHTIFGNHITEAFDNDLGKNVFNFLIHLTPDNDTSTGASDRQRLEIKTYASSPDNLKGTVGETVQYKWKFKIPTGFVPSPNFTHIHQLKAVGGDDGNPIFAITLRKSAALGATSKLELNYYPPGTSSATKLRNLEMSLFEGHWVEVVETVTYGDASTSSYDLSIKKISDNSILTTYNSNSLITFRANNTFVRPKWGIYRSIATPTGMKDETLFFADFSIEEIVALSVNDPEYNQNDIRIVPNPANNQIFIIESTLYSFNNIYIYDHLGRFLNVLKPISNSIDVSNLKSGIYYLKFNNDNSTFITKKLIIQ